MRKAVRVAAVTGSVLAADLLTKGLVRETMAPGESVAVLGEAVRLTYVLNPGAAFGLHVGDASRIVFTVLALVASAVVVLALLHTPRAEAGRVVALALVLGGALGNVLDRLRPPGAVVDFLDVGMGGLRWPIFNLADVAVTTGAVLLVLLLAGSSPGEEAAPERVAGTAVDPRR